MPLKGLVQNCYTAEVVLCLMFTKYSTGYNAKFITELRKLTAHLRLFAAMMIVNIITEEVTRK